jgi:hypothetical protein
MPPTLSGKFFLAEFILIVVPYGIVLVAGVGLLLMVAIGAVGSGDAEVLLELMVPIVVAIPYFAGFLISIAFLRGGGVGLLRTKRTTWILASIGALAASAAIVGTVMGQWIPWPFPTPTPEENPFGFAPETVGQAFARGLFLAPLLIPFGHLLWERNKAFSNISLQADRER